MKNTHKKITIIDTNRWGLKYGEKRQWYYKMRLDFFNDPLIQSLQNDTKIVFLALISESLRENSNNLSMCLEFIKHQLRVDLDSVKLSLRELKDNNIIELESNVRTQLIEENKRKENRTKQDPKSKIIGGTSLLMSEIFDLWNNGASRHGMSTLKVLNTTRKNKLKKACKEFKDIDDWKKIFYVASTKGFVNKDGSEFIPNFDYIFRNENYIKFYEEHDLIIKPSQVSREQAITNVEDYLMKGI